MSSISTCTILFVAITIGFSAQAAKDSGGSGGGKVDVERLALGGGIGTLYNQSSDEIVSFEHASIFYISAEGGVNEFIKGHFGAVGFGSQSVYGNINRTDPTSNQPLDNQPLEYYFTGLEIGTVLRLPIPFLQPWGGAGLVGGNSVISDPKERTTHNAWVVFDRDSKWSDGYYLSAGADLMLPVPVGFWKAIGVRGAYHHYTMRTDRHENLRNREAMRFNYEAFSAALLIAF